MGIQITAEYLDSQGLSETFPRRFWEKVFITPTHWLWEGPRKSPRLHGTIWRGVRNPNTGKWQWLIGAHVASWILNVGPIPEGKQVLHKCPGKHISWCVNPEHLYLGSDADNRRDFHQQVVDGFCKPSCVKLTKQQVDEIRNNYKGVHGEQMSTARAYGVSGAQIGNIVRGGAWCNNATDSYASMVRRWKEERERPRKDPSQIGELNNNSKLTKEIVAAIRAEYTGRYGQQSELARKYGVQQAAIWKIVNHEKWVE